MATAKKTQIVITANAAVAKKVMEELQQRIDGIKQKMAALDVTTKQGQREFKKLEKELVSYNSAVSQNITNTERISKAMKNLSGTSLNELKRALSAAKSELGKMSASDKGLKQMQNNVKALQGQINELTGAVNKQSGAWNTAMKNLTAYVGLFAAFNMLKTKLTEILNLNFKLSDQLADIRKVSGWAMDDVDELSNRLAKIDTRNTIQQLNELAYQGAKLGIGKYGVDGLTRFAEATAQIRMALHEDMGDEAIAQLAKMAEVMGDMENLGVSQSLLASGSAIFKLSATTTACGSNIMEFSKRLLGLGKTADLTTPQILALGSAADSMALMPEVASTAFNKFITTLQSKYAQVAKAVGMNQDRLKSLLDQHQTMQAIVEVLEHMRGMGDLNALAPIMGDLGSEGSRLTNVFASMASNVDMLKEHLATSEDEFIKATAVTAEFDIQNETSQALLERANNIWEKSFVNSDNAAGGIRDIASAWYEMTKAITGSLSFMAQAGLLMKGLTFGIQTFIGAIPALINVLIYMGAVKLATWAQWPVLFGAAKVAIDRVSTSMLNLVGVQSAAQKSAIAAARANQATAEAMYIQALSAKDAAVANQVFAVTQEGLAAANAAVAAADADLIAAQEMLATSTVELAAVTKIDSATLLEESEAKIVDAAATGNLTASEVLLIENKGMAAAMTNAESAAVAKETAAKEANAVATKNMRLAWGAVIFVAIIALIDKLYDNLKKLNAEEERNKDVTDKIANGLATANKEYEDACKNLRILYGELERNWNQMDERKRLIGEINAKYGDYVDNLVTETTKMRDLTGSLNDATNALRKYYYYKQKESLRADLVSEEQHKGDISFMKLQNMGGKYQDQISLDMAKSAIKEYAKPGVSAADITNNLWHDFFGGKAPGNYYMDLSKLPLIGGAFPKNTFRSEGQEAMSYLFDFVKSYVVAMDNESAIEKNFPGEWIPPQRKNKQSKDNTYKATNTGSGRNPNNTEKNVAKDRANALIANIKAFYEEQMRKYLEWVAQMNADGEKISEGQQKEQMDYLESRMNLALGKARQSIATLDNGWKEFFQYMDEDVMVYDDETSKQLLESIGKADVEGLHKLFTKLSGDLSRENNKTLAENLGALLDQIFANGSKELREAAEKLLARQREIQKILNEHDYTGAVNRNTRSEFDRLGFLQPAKDIRSDSPEGLEKMNAAFDKLTTKARESITVLYSLNPESKEFQSQFLDFLSVANEGFDFSKLKAQDLKALYLELIKYNDEYESASKKRDDERKTLNDYGWSKTDFYKDYQSKLPGMEQESSIKGGYRNVGQRMGIESVAASDPELELMKARMTYAQEYYKFLEEHNATEQQLADARKGIMSSQADYAKKLTGDILEQSNSLLSFMGPLQTFGEAAGEAFATMTESASEGRKQLRTALKQMIKSFATNTLQMISQQQIDRAQTTAHYTQLLLMQQAFAQAQLQAEIANGTAMIAAKQTVNLTEEQLEGIHQQVMAALRSAGIFGWCISTLGPIAGPIAYSAMMSILMGLINFAISKIGGSDKVNTNTETKSNTRVVSGMLTYDSGNVQDLRPFVGDDGSLYWATEDNKPHNGVSLITQPTATTINGHPSLVAENGPELVIGRETTQAMMMNNPQLLKALVNYDRNYSGRRAYDAGNIAETSTTIAAGATASEESAIAQTTTNIALLQAVNTLLQRLEQPIEAKIDMYGHGKLYDSMTKATQFMKNK